MKKIVIVGGVAGGATAAARIRRLDEKAQITVFERSGHISYANCGLPYYIGGAIKDASQLTLQTPESFRARFNIDMRVRHEVSALHPESKTVTVRNLDTGDVFEESYDQLLLAPGAKPVLPPLPGREHPRLYTLRTVEDTLRIRQAIDREQMKSALLIGGGFIGVELAENLREAGLAVTLIDLQPQLLNQLDPEMAAFIHAHMREKGVRLMLERGVSGFADDNGRIQAKLSDGSAVTADLAVLAIGVAPDSTLAKDAGLALGLRGSILVNERMETSIPDIYAVGDAVQLRHLVTGEPALISLAGPANKQARVAADNMCGLRSRYDGALGSSVLKVFDLTAAATGLSEKAAKAAGLRCDKVYLSPASHAGYYPGGKTMTMKVLFDPDSCRLLGAQIVGADGVDKRIDVLATAMHAGMDARSLKTLDLAYAPPYSSAKDPVNMAGFMIENLSNGLIRQFHWDEAGSLPQDGSVLLLDVRTPQEYARGHIDGFVNLPVDSIREHLSALEKGKPVYLVCQSALRSYIAARILSAHGFSCSHLAGGYRLYQTVMLDRPAAKTAAACGREG